MPLHEVTEGFLLSGTPFTIQFIPLLKLCHVSRLWWNTCTNLWQSEKSCGINWTVETKILTFICYTLTCSWAFLKSSMFRGRMSALLLKAGVGLPSAWAADCSCNQSKMMRDGYADNSTDAIFPYLKILQFRKSWAFVITYLFLLF